MIRTRRIEKLKKVLEEDWGDLYDFVDQLDASYIKRIIQNHEENLAVMKKVKDICPPVAKFNLNEAVEKTELLLNDLA